MGFAGDEELGKGGRGEVVELEGLKIGVMRKIHLFWIWWLVYYCPACSTYGYDSITV